MSEQKQTPDEVLAKYDMWQPISGEAKTRHEVQSHIAQALREAIRQRDALKVELQEEHELYMIRTEERNEARAVLTKIASTPTIAEAKRRALAALNESDLERSDNGEGAG